MMILSFAPHISDISIYKWIPRNALLLWNRIKFYSYIQDLYAEKPSKAPMTKVAVYRKLIEVFVIFFKYTKRVWEELYILYVKHLVL